MQHFQEGLADFAFERILTTIARMTDGFGSSWNAVIMPLDDAGRFVDRPIGYALLGGGAVILLLICLHLASIASTWIRRRVEADVEARWRQVEAMEAMQSALTETQKSLADSQNALMESHELYQEVLSDGWRRWRQKNAASTLPPPSIHLPPPPAPPAGSTSTTEVEASPPSQTGPERTEHDNVEAFFDNYLVQSPGAKIKASALFAIYEDKCVGAPVSQQAFYRSAKMRIGASKSHKDGNYYHGVAVRGMLKLVSGKT